MATERMQVWGLVIEIRHTLLELRMAGIKNHELPTKKFNERHNSKKLTFRE